MKKQFLSLTLFLFTMAAGSNAQSRQGYTYSVPSAPWEESFGNHRGGVAGRPTGRSDRTGV